MTVSDEAEGTGAVGELAHLLSCIGPTCGDNIDWKVVEAVYGRSLPADYRRFVDTFGRGTIEQMVVVRGPATGRGRMGGSGWTSSTLRC
ncbi:hypothetical protein A6A07_31215 [Streptomyces sp. CB03911]|nr:hypothetical protein A6A07_31215 [Streptomyces sp. CB03911]